MTDCYCIQKGKFDYRRQNVVFKVTKVKKSHFFCAIASTQTVNQMEILTLTICVKNIQIEDFQALIRILHHTFPKVRALL